MKIAGKSSCKVAIAAIIATQFSACEGGREESSLVQPGQDQGQAQTRMPQTSTARKSDEENAILTKYVVPCETLSPPTAEPVGAATELIAFTGLENFKNTFDVGERISNGREANQQEGGAAVSILISKEGDAPGACTGSRISNDWVLTAAHCFYGLYDETKRVNDVKIFNNSLKKFSGRKIGGKAFCHKNYGFRSGHYANDVALIKLNEPIDGPVMSLVSSADPRMRDRGARQIVTALGYGQLTPTESSRVLMAGEVSTARPETQCGRGQARNSTFCTLTVGEDGIRPSSICPGDSGGPALLRLPDGSIKQVGINSFIANSKSPVACGKRGNYSAFVDLTQYAHWIKDILDATEEI